MKRFLLTVSAMALGVVVGIGVIGVVGFAAFRSGFGPRAVEAAVIGPWTGEMPAEIRDLHNLPPAERFGHFLGGQMRFSDTSNTAHSVAITPGTVSAVKADELTITPNDGGGSKSFALNADTRIHATGQPWSGPQSASPKAGDRVVVVTLDGSSAARAVVIGGPDGFGPRGPFQHGG